MKENEQNTDRANKFYQKEVEMEHANVAQGTVVCKLVANNLMRHEPADENTSEETHDGQEQLTCYEVEEIDTVILKNW